MLIEKKKKWLLNLRFHNSECEQVHYSVRECFADLRNFTSKAHNKKTAIFPFNPYIEFNSSIDSTAVYWITEKQLQKEARLRKSRFGLKGLNTTYCKKRREICEGTWWTFGT